MQRLSEGSLTLSLLMTNDFRKNEYRRMQYDTRKGEHAPPQEETGPIDEEQQTLERPIRRPLDLMVGDAQVAEKSVVRDDPFSKSDYTRLMLVV